MNNGAAQNGHSSAELLLRILFTLEEIRDDLRAQRQQRFEDEPESPDWLPTNKMVLATGCERRRLLRWREKHRELRELAPDVPSGQRLRWHRDAVPWLRQRGLI